MSKKQEFQWYKTRCSLFEDVIEYAARLGHEIDQWFHHAKRHKHHHHHHHPYCGPNDVYELIALLQIEIDALQKEIDDLQKKKDGTLPV